MPAQQNIWLWDDANSVWEQAPAAVVTKRLIAAGPVIAGAHKLYWVSMNPDAANSEVVLTDDTDGSTATVFDMFHPDRVHMHMALNPPMQFDTGIYLKILTNFTSIMFGYI